MVVAEQVVVAADRRHDAGLPLGGAQGPMDGEGFLLGGQRSLEVACAAQRRGQGFQLDRREGFQARLARVRNRGTQAGGIPDVGNGRTLFEGGEQRLHEEGAAWSEAVQSRQQGLSGIELAQTDQQHRHGFQAAHLPRQRRLGNAQHRGGAREAAQVGDLHEVVQLPDVHRVLPGNRARGPSCRDAIADSR